MAHNELHNGKYVDGAVLEVSISDYFICSFRKPPQYVVSNRIF